MKLSAPPRAPPSFATDALICVHCPGMIVLLSSLSKLFLTNFRASHNGSQTRDKKKVLLRERDRAAFHTSICFICVPDSDGGILENAVTYQQRDVFRWHFYETRLQMKCNSISRNLLPCSKTVTCLNLKSKLYLAAMGISHTWMSYVISLGLIKAEGFFISSWFLTVRLDGLRCDLNEMPLSLKIIKINK